jgi:hypothetical protein
MKDPAIPKVSKSRLKLLDKQLEPQQVEPSARREAAAVLEVLAGVRTPQQAAEALEVSLPTYFNLETRALRGLMIACSHNPRGRQRSLAPQLREANTRLANLERQVQRYQALLRTAQRTVGLSPTVEPARGVKGKGRRKKPMVRALRVIELLKQPDGSEPGSPVLSETGPVAVIG